MSREAGWATYIMAWKEGMSMWAGTDRSGTHLVAELDEGLGPRELWRGGAQGERGRKQQRWRTHRQGPKPGTETADEDQGVWGEAG